MTEETQIFEVEVDGVVKTAELLRIFEMDGKEYAIYSIKNDDGTYDILASYVKQDEEGYDTFEDIIDPADRAKVAQAIKELANENA